jgi:hypothetical protein
VSIKRCGIEREVTTALDDNGKTAGTPLLPLSRSRDGTEMVLDSISTQSQQSWNNMS